MTSLRRHRRALLLGALGFLAGLSTPTAAEEEDARGGRTVLVVFVSYRVALPMALHPTSVRLAGTQALADALEDRGQDVVTYPDIEPSMRRWRVRSERDLTPEFFDELVSEHAADRLVVASVAVYRDRLIVPARGIRLETGEVFWADVGERPTRPDQWSDTDTALADLEYTAVLVGRQLAGGWDERRSAPSWRVVVPLPLRPVGTEPGLTDVATHCLLRSLLEIGDWTVPDPSLVAMTMLEAGFDPYQLASEARGTLAERFGAESLVIPRLAGFELRFGVASRAAAAEPDDDEVLPPGRELGSGVPVYFSLSRVDCATGEVISGSGMYLAPQDPAGIFGVAREVRIAGRYQKGADELVRSLVRARS